MRRDLADVRLAGRVFAPHYAEPLLRRLVSPAALRDQRKGETTILAELSEGAMFELLEVSGGIAWGVAQSEGLVGYIPAAALGVTSQ